MLVSQRNKSVLLEFSFDSTYEWPWPMLISFLLVSSLLLIDSSTGCCCSLAWSCDCNPLACDCKTDVYGYCMKKYREREGEGTGPNGKVRRGCWTSRGRSRQDIDPKSEWPQWLKTAKKWIFGFKKDGGECEKCEVCTAWCLHCPVKLTFHQNYGQLLLKYCINIYN